MSSKISIFIFVFIICVLFVGWKGISMRREIPFQEVIPLNRGIIIINSDRWFMNALKISINGHGMTQELSYDKKGICLIKGLSNHNQYTLEITQTDLKGMLLYKKLKMKVTPKIHLL